MNQTGGKVLVMEAEATSHLQKLGVSPTDDKPKYIWHKVIVSFLESENSSYKQMILIADASCDALCVISETVVSAFFFYKII